jgi:cytidylate kinase
VLDVIFISIHYQSKSRGIQVALPRTIAIDGPAGSGKSSVSFAVARDLGYLYVDTGAFYRAVTLVAIQTGMLEADEASLVKVAQNAAMDITPDRNTDDREYTLLLNGKDATWEIRSPEVETHVSRISAVGGVREVLRDKQRAMATGGKVIMVGRDIGTVVLPDADLKIYLDASPEARAQRRYRQRITAGQPADYDDILAGLRSRDSIDSQRDVAPLRIAPDAKYVNTDNLDVETVIEQIKQIILNWQAPVP